jgi:hypothetical protein
VSLVAEALDSKMSDSLRAQVLNSLAYFQLELFREQNNSNLLAEAARNVGQMENLFPTTVWIGRFLDTKGCILLERAKLGEEAEENRSRAIELFQQALHGGSLSDYEKELIQIHLEEAISLNSRT